MKKMRILYCIGMMLIFNLVKSQTFSNNSVSLQGSWNNSLTKTINVSGLSDLSAGTFELVQVNLNLGRQLDNSRNFSRYSITITSPTGQTINLVNNPSTFPNALVKEINTKFRDNSYLRLPSDHGTTAEPFHVGYYRSFQPYTSFNGTNPNGNWTIIINENSVDTGARFNSVDLVFRSPYTVTDYTTLTSYDSCASPYCLGTSQIIVASNNSFTSQPTDLFNPNTSGCSWNAAQNNSAWFKFRALNSNVKISISGVTGNLQILGVASSNSNPCATSSLTVLDGGCPNELINDTYLSPQYVNGSTKNNQLNLSGLTPGEFYYFIVDGTGGSVSPFYIEVEGTSPDCSNCNLNPTVTSNSPICSNQTINLTCSEGASWSWTGPDGFTSNLQNPTIANASITNAGTYTIVIMDSNGCSETRTTEVIVNSLITPIFNTPNPICNGESLSPLPLVSNNGVTGTWSPVLNNTTTTTYTFTPNASECSTPTTLTITINNCTFGIYASAVWMDDCLTTNDGKFFNTSGSGIDLINQDGSLFTGNNYGVHLQNSNTLILRGAEVKTFKSNVTNVCSAQLNYRVYLQGDAPGVFSTITLPFYSDCNTTINEFFVGGGPCQSNDQKWQRVIADGITVPFSPVNLTNLSPGNYVLEVYYDITGDFSSNSQCDDVLLLNNGGTNYAANFTIQANPQFVAQSPTTCDGNDGSIIISNLVPNTTYSISYQFNTSTIATTNYTANNLGSIVLNNLSIGNYSNFNFTINGCNSLINSVVVIDNPVFTPLFNDVNPICFGENISALPTTSLNNITGFWTPSINNSATTVYTFTPDANQCALSTTLTISVLPEIQATTTSQPNTICNGASSGCVPTGTHLLLNEIRHYPTTAQGLIGTGTEYIELYNPTCNPIDASCFILGSASRPNANPGSSLATGGSIILPQGTIINPKSHFVIGTSTSSTNSSSVDFKTDLNLSNYCVTGNFVLPNGDGWVALYNASGNPIDAVYWTVGANQANKISTDDDLDDAPCTPTSVASCSTSGISLLSAKGIYELNSSLINYLGISTPNPIVPTGLTFSRIPDGSSWQSQINPSIDVVNCNNGICDTLSPSTCNGSATVNVQTTGNYSYLWNDSANQTNATAINLCAGDYCVSITNLDTNCTTQVCVTVIDNIPLVDPVFPFSNTFTICEGEVVPSLPILSDNAISGTWSPTVVSATSSGSYLFTPNSGQCSNPFTLNVTVNPLQTPTFAFGNALTICGGEVVPSLPTLSDNIISGTWSPAVVSATSSGSYLFTPNSGQCSNPFTLNVTVNPLQTPAFAFGNALTICNGEAVPSLPTISDNAILGTWSPSVVSATSSGSYLFTPNSGQCANPFTLNVTVNSLQTPTFAFGNALTICEGEAVPSLPTLSDNAISGTWSPTVISATSSGSYVFTPNSGQCANPFTLNVTVNPLQTPIFDFGNSISVCNGDAIPVLSTISNNGITGVWSPSVVSNTNSDTYTFTPNAGQCANLITFVVTVNQIVTPTFSFGTSITLCQGDFSPQVLLPEVSQEGVNGTWNPSTIDFSILGATVYTFTPAANQCATTTTYTVTTNPNVTPIFAFGNTLTICEGEVVPSLPILSDNAISGTWSPTVVSATSSGSYLFTPNSGQCSNPFTLNVTVNPLPQFTITHGCVETDYVIRVNSNLSNLTYTWYNFTGNIAGNQSTLLVDEEGDYTVIVSLGNCSLESSVYLSNVYCEIPKGISPNNDGLNDFFELSNLNVRNLKIYNRYGVEVYSKENYTNQWNGKCNKGNELPDATYYYVIEFNSGNSKTGWVYINR